MSKIRVEFEEVLHYNPVLEIITANTLYVWEDGTPPRSGDYVRFSGSEEVYRVRAEPAALWHIRDEGLASVTIYVDKVC